MLFSLALRDLIYERLLSLCVVAALCAVITPLLILFSLRYGVLDALYQRLSSDPGVLEISLGTNVRLSDSDIAALAARPDVGFVVPRTRSLSLTVSVKGRDRVVQRVETLPSALNDPLLVAAGLNIELGDYETVISRQLQEALRTAPGEDIAVVVPRTAGGRQQTAVVRFTVRGVLPGALLPRPALLVNVPVTCYMEDYRDGYEPPVFSDGAQPGRTRAFYPKVRIYARSMEDVPALSAHLGQLTTVYDHSAQIAGLRRITSVLDFLFAGIALPSVIGGTIAFCGLIVSLINRKQRSYALLRLAGLKLRSLYLIVLIEGALMAMSAFVISVVLYAVVAYFFNAHFAPHVQELAAVSKLSALHLGTALAATLLLTGLTAVGCAWALLRVPLQRALRMG